LPNLEIVRFHGSYSEWPDFLATFTTVIANDNELSDIEKLHYLGSSLSSGGSSHKRFILSDEYTDL